MVSAQKFTIILGANQSLTGHNFCGPKYDTEIYVAKSKEGLLVEADVGARAIGIAEVRPHNCTRTSHSIPPFVVWRGRREGQSWLSVLKMDNATKVKI